MDQWLPVLDYAVYKRMSISTLRRRIKSQVLEHKLEHGRYLIRAELDAGAQPSMAEGPNESLAVVESLVGELKKAYSLALAEKEELIQQLRSEIETLRHINQFLEMQIMNEGRRNNSPPDLNY